LSERIQIQLIRIVLQIMQLFKTSLSKIWFSVDQKGQLLVKLHITFI